METGCQNGIINCCYCNCLNSINVTISHFVISLIGIIPNLYIIFTRQKDFKEFNISLVLQYINIFYFGSSSIIILIILIFRQSQKIDRPCAYKFGSYSTLIYSYLAKIFSIINIFLFIYLLGFYSMIGMNAGHDTAKSLLKVTNVGLNGEIDLIHGTEGVKLDCDKMDCFDNEKEETLEKGNYIDLLIYVAIIIVSIILLFYSGAAFTSENLRIKMLIKGRIEIEFIPKRNDSFCDKKFCDFLNPISCYRLTILRILNFITILSFISFISLLSIYIIGLKMSWPQAIFFLENIGTPLGGVLSALNILASIYCKDVKSCDFSTPPSKRKCYMFILLILTILFFPLQIIGFITIFNSQIGNSYIFIDCSFNDPCNDLFTIIDKYRRSKYAFKIFLNKSSFKHIIIGFILGIIPPICFFFLIVLQVSYIWRSLIEYNTLDRIYDSRLVSIEDNGERIDINSIEVTQELVKYKKINNEEEVEQEVVIYIRKNKYIDAQNHLISA